MAEDDNGEESEAFADGGAGTTTVEIGGYGAVRVQLGAGQADMAHEGDGEAGKDQRQRIAQGFHPNKASGRFFMAVRGEQQRSEAGGKRCMFGDRPFS